MDVCVPCVTWHLHNAIIGYCDHWFIHWLIDPSRVLNVRVLRTTLEGDRAQWKAWTMVGQPRLP